MTLQEIVFDEKFQKIEQKFRHEFQHLCPYYDEQDRLINFFYREFLKTFRTVYTIESKIAPAAQRVRP